MACVRGLGRAVVLAWLALPIGQVAAAGPRVVADIAPVHSLVSLVMEGVGEPDLLLPPGASPHGYALRPSDARALDRAELVFWVGPLLTPWLEETLASLAGDAVLIELGGAPGVVRLPVRRGGEFEKHDHDHAYDRAQGREGPDGAAQGHHVHQEAGQRRGPDARDHGHDAPHQRAGSHRAMAMVGYDPHLWLDPGNAAAWLGAIAKNLAAADPTNAARYRANADAARAVLTALERDIRDRVAPVRHRPFIVFHDAYQYFEAHFGVSAAGAISLGDASRPSAARVSEVRELINRSGAVCVFAEPQFEPRLLETVIEGTDIRKGVLDPVGTALTPGAGLYSQLLLNLARDLVACLSGED